MLDFLVKVCFLGQKKPPFLRYCVRYVAKYSVKKRHFQPLLALGTAFGLLFSPCVTAKRDLLKEKELEFSVWMISNSVSAGTAFAVGPNQFITNFHIFNRFFNDPEQKNQDIVLSNKEGKTIPFDQILKIDYSNDLALFQTQETTPYYVNDIKPVFVEDEEELVILAYPEAQFQKIKKTYPISTRNPLFFTFAIDSMKMVGSSGGLVVKPEDSEVVAVVIGGIKNMLDVIPSENLQALLNGRGSVLSCLGMGDKNCVNQALEDLHALALSGDIKAQYLEAMNHYTGVGGQRDYDLAFKGFNQLALRGFAPAQHNLANMYSRGLGTKTNKQLSREWFEQASLQNNASAQDNLARIYDKGIGVKKDKVLGVTWLKRAARQGFVLSQYDLALRYYVGADLEQNNFLALEWFQKADEQNFSRAERHIEDLNRIIARELEKAETKAIQQAHNSQSSNSQKGSNLFAEENDLDSSLSSYFARTDSFKEDTSSLVLNTLSSQHISYALSFLNSNLETEPQPDPYTGSLDVKSPLTAETIEDIKQWAEEGEAYSQFVLGFLFFKGEFIPKDDEKALKWLKSSSDQGILEAKLYLAILYIESEEMEISKYQEAVSLLLEAAVGDLAKARSYLASLFAYGILFKKDNRLAYFWFQEAIKAGDFNAGVKRNEIREALSEEEIQELKEFSLEGVRQRVLNLALELSLEDFIQHSLF